MRLREAKTKSCRRPSSNIARRDWGVAFVSRITALSYLTIWLRYLVRIEFRDELTAREPHS
jgi:hypothetical protein